MSTLILKETAGDLPDSFSRVELPVEWTLSEAGRYAWLHSSRDGGCEVHEEYIREHCSVAYPREYNDISEFKKEFNVLRSVEDVASVLELLLGVYCDVVDEEDEDGSIIDIHYAQVSHSDENVVKLFEHIVFNTEDISLEDVSIYLSADTSGIGYFRQMSEGWNISIVVSFVGAVRVNTDELTRIVNTVKRFKTLIDLMVNTSNFEYET